MWGAILSLLSSIAALLSGWQEERQKEKIKQDGRNEEKLENIDIIQRRKSRARAIIDRLRDEKANSDK